MLNAEQKETFKTLQKFLKHPAANTFVLKGYAGTGKTFLMQHLAKWLNEEEEKFCMLASTGRAATVLRGKTGFEAKTVHSELYQFSKVEGAGENLPIEATIDQYGQMTLQFTLRIPDEAKRVYIIDEASMLASDFTGETSFASFGSGMLLMDFFEASGRNKIIFVGDPCQLPPVGQLFSPALNMDWLAEQKRTAISVTLQKIERTKGDNDILRLASVVRNLAEQTSWVKWPKLPARNLKNVHVCSTPQKLFQEYLKCFRELGNDKALAIARSNKTVQQINRAFRRELYGKIDLPLQKGDVLLVTQNNYAVPLTNGDFVTVEEIGEKMLQANLVFQKVRVIAALSGISYEILLSLDILESKLPNFTREQMKALMVDFTRRMRNKGVAPNTEKYKMAMMEDSYLNCLRATYGYAVTCHKAQGGEWDEVFLFLDKGMYGMPRPELCRWWYTAITRARETLHLSDDWWIIDFSKDIVASLRLQSGGI